MYYVWKKDIGLVDENKYAYFDDEPDGYELTDWVSGNRMKKLPELTLNTDPEYVTNLSDLLLTGFDLHVFSQKLVDVLNTCGIKNIDYYPVKIIEHDTGKEIDSYCSANIVGNIPCLDEENSECFYSSKDNTIIGLDEFSIFEDKIKATSEMDCEPLFFRLAEFEFIILVHESVKQRIEEEGVTGIEFIKPEDYF